MGALRAVRTAVWGAPAETKAERRLIVKIDAFILSSCCLQYWVNYLDRSNLNNAYVSGMKEELNMGGKDLNYINTIFWCGYVVGQIPNNLAMQYFRPRYWMTFCIIAWGLCTLGTAFVHSKEAIMCIRAFQALFEGSTFVGTHYLLGSWYKEAELGKRTGIFTSSGLAGTLFSGFMQGSIYTSLNGKSGLHGWRWMFIIDFLVTLPIALYVFLLFPDTPETTKAFYLTQDERELSVSRLRRDHSTEHVHGEVNKQLFKRLLSTWELYAFCFIWTMGANCEMFSTNAVLNLYLKWTEDYTVQMVNYMPMGVSAVGIVGTLVLGWYSDFSGGSWHVGVITSCTAIISGAIMLNPPNRAATMFALYLNGIQYANQTVMFAWASKNTFGDAPKRAIILAAMNTSAVVFYCWWPILFYAADQAPAWRAGSIAIIASAIAMLGGVLVIRHLEARRKSTEAGPFVVEKGQDDSINFETSQEKTVVMTNLDSVSGHSSRDEESGRK
ncbi:hypothetical protein PV10_00674 [Exophiala mesophila]|uniref:Major facilitator superfamily (MFS) profile domain-containing protein n=1 Tax=Exophiala mesophila TaxID=212818 RepID=A0A0D1ZSG6_EXOME|nr:uncharacterized protein PV10_00674 [Exophiala mesophila]KIV96859.1 hypothetical protein PV10_00674 [Exophiala mesophila]